MTPYCDTQFAYLKYTYLLAIVSSHVIYYVTNSDQIKSSNKIDKAHANNNILGHLIKVYVRDELQSRKQLTSTLVMTRDLSTLCFLSSLVISSRFNAFQILLSYTLYSLCFNFN